jgi:hypothetical protein
MALEVRKGLVRLEVGTSPLEELNFRPRALVLWWCRERGAGCAGGIGFATDGGGDASTAWGADDALAPGVFSRLGAEAPLLFHADPRTPEASLPGHVRFAARGFSLVCDREPEHPWLVHYLALGGSGAPSATVRNLVLDDVGTRSVDGLGFTPGLVLAALGAGSGAGEPQPSLAAGFGAAARPGKQVAGAFVSQADAEQMVARGVQASDAFAVLPAATASGDIAVLSRLVSFDQDGFTLETTRLASELPLAALVLEEGSYAVGLGAASQAATATGFDPAGAILFGTGLTATAHARDIGRLCVGGFSRDQSAGCVSWSTRQHGWPPEPRSRSSPDGAFEVIDTTSGELHARATLSALGRRRFSLAWPARDAYRRHFGYIAFGSEPPEHALRSRLRLRGRGDSIREYRVTRYDRDRRRWFGLGPINPPHGLTNLPRRAGR